MWISLGIDLWQLQNGGGGSAPYTLSRSVRLRSAASASLSKTPASAGDRKTWTWKASVKRGKLGATQFLMGAGTGVGDYCGIVFESSDALTFQHRTSGTTDQALLRTNAVFRDQFAYIDIQIAVDTTQATAADRAKLYVDGVQITSFSSTTNFTLNYDNLFVNNTVAHAVGALSTFGSYFDGLITDVYFIDGQALTPSSFGEVDGVTGEWKSKAYSGAYGTNGYHLTMADNSALTTVSNAGIGKDYGPNGNFYVTNNISITAGATYDSFQDVPTRTDSGAANFCVMNPLAQSNATVTNANLTVATPNSSYGVTLGSMAIPTTGKWYWEMTASVLASDSVLFGIANASVSRTTNLGGDANGWGYFAVNGNKLNNGSSTAYGSTFTTGDTIGIAFDADNQALYFAKNGTWMNSGVPTSGASKTGAAFTSFTGTLFPCLSDGGNGMGATANCNFGQRPFAQTPPTGYTSLNTYNIPAGSVVASGTFTGNASADGPFVYLNGNPETLTINGNAVTWGTHADKLANGFKVRSSSASYNTSGSNTFSVTLAGNVFKYNNAQINP